MKKSLILTIFLLAGIFSTSAQELQFGLKGGINKTFGGQITARMSAVGYSDDTYNAEGNIGYHGGAWIQVNLGRFFVRPEIVYTKLESTFDFPQRPVIYAVDELSAPFLIGYNVFGPIDIYAGPAYKKILESNIEQTEPPDQTIVVQDIPISAQVGVKAQFGAFGIDVRYDQSLASRQPQGTDFIAGGPNPTNPTVNLATIDDARLNQLIVSLTIKLFDTANAGKKRRGGSCYF